MSRVLFEKTGSAVWISHLDLMRVFQRSFRRAGMMLKHTQGYSPRAIVSIALPLSVGVESRCDVDVGQGGRKVRENMSPLQLFERSLSKKDPQFLKGGSYHFAVPNGQGKEWERVWGERKQRVEAMMRRFWDAWAYEGLLSAATRSSRGATTSCGRCRRVSRTARVAWR